jgi:hypothetical protein
MATQIFRCYPARGQAYIAECLESEGWFDDEGWVIKGWFDQSGRDAQEVRVGVEGKYHAGPKWLEAYNMYLEVGRANGLYLYPAQRAQLETEARAIREKLKLNVFQSPPLRKELRDEYGVGYDAQQKLAVNEQLRNMTNYDAHLAQAEGEKDARTVRARKLLYQAGQYRKDEQEALPLYERAWPLWLETCIRNPRFAQTQYAHEDVYEATLRWMKLNQMHHPQTFRTATLIAAQMAIAPHPFWPRPANWNWERWPYWDAPRKNDPMLDPALKEQKIDLLEVRLALAQAAIAPCPFWPRAALWNWERWPYWDVEAPMINPNIKAKLVDVVRVSHAPLEAVMYYDGPESPAVRDFAFAWTFTAGRLGQLSFTPPVPLPDQQRFALAGAVWERQDTAPTNWRYLIDSDTVRQARVRRGLLPQPTATKAPPGASKAPPGASK